MRKNTNIQNKNSKAKALYESIMKDVAKIVKKRVDESMKVNEYLSDFEFPETTPQDMYYNPEYNDHYANKYDGVLLKNGSIGIQISITDDDNETSTTYTPYFKAIGYALEYYDILLQAILSNPGDTFFTVECSPEVRELFKEFRNNIFNDDALSDSIDSRVDAVAPLFSDVQDLDDFIYTIQSPEFKAALKK